MKFGGKLRLATVAAVCAGLAGCAREPKGWIIRSDWSLELNRVPWLTGHGPSYEPADGWRDGRHAGIAPHGEIVGVGSAEKVDHPTFQPVPTRPVFEQDVQIDTPDAVIEDAEPPAMIHDPTGDVSPLGMLEPPLPDEAGDGPAIRDQTARKAASPARRRKTGRGNQVSWVSKGAGANALRPTPGRKGAARARPRQTP